MSTWQSRDDPDYRDPTEGVAEMTEEELLTWLDLAETCAIDPDLPARTRHQCDDAVRILSAEIEARRIDEARADLVALNGSCEVEP